MGEVKTAGWAAGIRIFFENRGAVKLRVCLPRGPTADPNQYVTWIDLELLRNANKVAFAIFFPTICKHHSKSILGTVRALRCVH